MAMEGIKRVFFSRGYMVSPLIALQLMLLPHKPSVNLRKWFYDSKKRILDTAGKMFCLINIYFFLPVNSTRFDFFLNFFFFALPCKISIMNVQSLNEELDKPLNMKHFQEIICKILQCSTWMAQKRNNQPAQ